MLPFFFTDSLFMLIALWALYALGYFGIIRKMGVEQGFAFVPVAAEWRISKILFSSMRSFYQAALSATSVFCSGWRAFYCTVSFSCG